MKKFIITFTSALLLLTFTTVNVFASGGYSYLSHDVKLIVSIKGENSSKPGGFSILRDWQLNPQKYVTFVKSANPPTFRDGVTSVKSRLDIISVDTLNSANFVRISSPYINYTGGGTNLPSGVCLVVLFDGNLNEEIFVENLYLNRLNGSPNTNYSFNMQCILKQYSNSAFCSKYNDIVTDKITLSLFKTGEPPKPPDPPKPPIPPVPPTPPNKEMLPWYPSDGLKFLDGHIKQTTGNVVTVSIKILAIILGVLVMIRIVKMFSKG